MLTFNTQPAEAMRGSELNQDLNKSPKDRWENGCRPRKKWNPLTPPLGFLQLGQVWILRRLYWGIIHKARVCKLPESPNVTIENAGLSLAIFQRKFIRIFTRIQRQQCHYFVTLILFLDRVLCGSDWPQNYYVATDNLELLIFLLPPPECWDLGMHHHTPVIWCWGSVQGSCMPGKHSSD